MKPIGEMTFMSNKGQSISQPSNESMEVVQTQLKSDEQTESTQKSHNCELQEQVKFLCEKVQQLSNELQTTRQSHQLSSEQTRAQVNMLESELKNQRIRHEEVVSSLRERLVESELARNKIQDQMMQMAEEENKKELVMASRWNEMITKVNEDAKWVDEQMACWKESLKEHEKRMGAATVRGELKAELAESTKIDEAADENKVGEETAAERRIQRRSLLQLDENFSDDE